MSAGAGLDDTSLLASVAEQARLIDETVEFIHAHPELAHHEYACAGHLVSVLRGLGYHVETPIAGMDTAFRATLEGARPGRTVALVALYDAVASVPPEGGIKAVHSCGHGPIAGGVVGAAAALAALRSRFSGRVTVVGCPADEIHAPDTIARGGGKALSASAGVWRGVDAALYAHPEWMDTAWTSSLWMRRDTAHVAGTRDLSVGASQPVPDAVEAAIRSVAALPPGRAALEHLELDGDIEPGGGMVATATVLLWAETEGELERLAAELRAQVPATWHSGRTVPAIEPDPTVRATVLEAIAASGRVPVADPPALPFATDFGAVTREVPAALVGVSGREEWAFHTPAGETQFESPAGADVARGMAEVLCLSTIRLLEPR